MNEVSLIPKCCRGMTILVLFFKKIYRQLSILVHTFMSLPYVIWYRIWYRVIWNIIWNRSIIQKFLCSILFWSHSFSVYKIWRLLCVLPQKFDFQVYICVYIIPYRVYIFINFLYLELFMLLHVSWVILSLVIIAT